MLIITITSPSSLHSNFLDLVSILRSTQLMRSASKKKGVKHALCWGLEHQQLIPALKLRSGRNFDEQHPLRTNLAKKICQNLSPTLFHECITSAAKSMTLLPSANLISMGTAMNQTTYICIHWQTQQDALLELAWVGFVYLLSSVKSKKAWVLIRRVVCYCVRVCARSLLFSAVAFLSCPLRCPLWKSTCPRLPFRRALQCGQTLIAWNQSAGTVRVEYGADRSNLPGFFFWILLHWNWSLNLNGLHLAMLQNFTNCKYLKNLKNYDFAVLKENVLEGQNHWFKRVTIVKCDTYYHILSTKHR